MERHMPEATRSWPPWELDDGELDATQVRDILLAQHDRLRSLLAGLDTRAVGVIRGESRRPVALDGAFEETAEALSYHMRAEEQAFAELMPRTASFGTELDRLREEHEQQRDELERMRRLAASSDDAISLALAVRAFVADVRLDMESEDRRYLSADAPMSVRT
jgi:iron-sulfur cluster repair protein YtfE (RIC family)